MLMFLMRTLWGVGVASATVFTGAAATGIATDTSTKNKNERIIAPVLFRMVLFLMKANPNPSFLLRLCLGASKNNTMILGLMFTHEEQSQLVYFLAVLAVSGVYQIGDE